MDPLALSMLSQEARALLTRLARVHPFALHEGMVPAAALLPKAQSAIEQYLVGGRRELWGLIREFLAWLSSPAMAHMSAAQVQQRFSFLRLKFNAVLTQFDTFNSVITQRSEHEIGVWLSGLDVVCADALALPESYYEMPPIICYLDRGVGAAIRRARTRLPGGGSNPVSIIRVPRERMVGSGIASSIVHEVGHQAAALLDLTTALRPVLKGMQRGGSPHQDAWVLWDRWISEIVADFWSVARIGIGSTLGLMGVVSLPRPFVFRMAVDDPHPIPWFRVKLSCAMGNSMYPHPQWARILKVWESLYPPVRIGAARERIFAELNATMPGFIAMLMNVRPPLLRGRSLVDVLETSKRQPALLIALFNAWSRNPAGMYRASPCLAFAVIGQARANGALSPEEESDLIAKLLTHWALRSTLDMSSTCAVLGRGGLARALRAAT